MVNPPVSEVLVLPSRPSTPVDPATVLTELPVTPYTRLFPPVAVAEPTIALPPSRDVLPVIALTFAVVVENVPVPVMLVALKLPVASRLTMALAVSALVGATFHPNFKVPADVIGEPFTMKSLVGAVNPTLVTVPVPMPALLQAHALPFHFNI